MIENNSIIQTRIINAVSSYSYFRTCIYILINSAISQILTIIKRNKLSLDFYSNALLVNAKIRQGPPVPPTILIGWTTSLNPFAGNVVPFRATFSRLYMLALESILCASFAKNSPASMLGVSTPKPYTFPVFTIHWAASLDTPGNLKNTKKILFLKIKKHHERRGNVYAERWRGRREKTKNHGVYK